MSIGSIDYTVLKVDHLCMSVCVSLAGTCMQLVVVCCCPLLSGVWCAWVGRVRHGEVYFASFPLCRRLERLALVAPVGAGHRLGKGGKPFFFLLFIASVVPTSCVPSCYLPLPHPVKSLSISVCESLVQPWTVALPFFLCAVHWDLFFSQGAGSVLSFTVDFMIGLYAVLSRSVCAPNVRFCLRLVFSFWEQCAVKPQ